MAAKSGYNTASKEIFELFADHIDGTPDRPAVALSVQVIDALSRDAIERSLGSFGYSPQACTFVATSELDPQALFILIEGLDPIHVISADSQSTTLLSQAYRTNFPLDSPIRVLGRQSLAFENLSTLIATDKRKAWSLFKTLP